jgi:hypothetical protein
MIILAHQVSAQITPEFDEYIEKRMTVERIPGISITYPLIHFWGKYLQIRLLFHRKMELRSPLNTL